MLDAYYSDPEATKKQAGALLPDEKVAVMSVTGNSELYTCPVFFDEYPLSETYSMGCTSEEHPEIHRFSLDAWREYLKNKALEGNECIFATCLMDGCKCIVPPSVWDELLSLPVSRSVLFKFYSALSILAVSWLIFDIDFYSSKSRSLRTVEKL